MIVSGRGSRGKKARGRQEARYIVYLRRYFLLERIEKNNRYFVS